MPVGPEIVIIVAVLLLLFGGKKIPQFARGLGTAQREFREGLRDGDNAGVTTSTTESGEIEAAAGLGSEDTK